jgi:hypothetical protein
MKFRDMNVGIRVTSLQVPLSQQKLYPIITIMYEGHLESKER